MNPFRGTWVANLEKSRRHADHQFRSATLTFEVSDDVVSLTHTGVNMAGKPESGTTVLHAAAMRGDTEDIIRVLVEKGARVAARNKKGQTALDVALVNHRGAR